MEPRVIDAIFYLTSGDETQYGRNFQTNRTSETVRDTFLRETNDGRHLDATTMARAVSDIIELRPNVGRNDIIEIANGWQEERMAFILVVLTEDYAGAACKQILTGFTDKADLSTGGKMDPDMVLYINNTFTVRENEIDTGRGRRRDSRMESSEYIIRGRRATERNILGVQNHDTLIRPQDIFFQKSEAQTIGRFGGADTYNDARTNLTGDFKTARRIHNNPANYLSDIIRTGVTAETVSRNERGTRHADDNNMDEEMERLDDLNPDERAAAMLRGTELHRNELFRNFLSRTEYERNAEISFREFLDCVVWPDNVEADMIGFGSARKESRTHVGEGEGNKWNGGNPTTLAAEMIAKTLPALVMNNFISSALIEMTNETIDGQIHCRVLGARPLIRDMNIERYEIALEQRLETDLGLILSRNNQLSFNMSVNIKVTTHLEIKISVNGSKMEPFRSPVYCDGLLSPMKADSSDILTNIVNDMDDLITAAVDGTSRGTRAAREDGGFADRFLSDF